MVINSPPIALIYWLGGLAGVPVTFDGSSNSRWSE